MFRMIWSLLVTAAMLYGGWWVWNNVPEVKAFVKDKLQTGEFLTLEARYSGEDIYTMYMGNDAVPGEALHQPRLLYSPHLLMEVKYIYEGKTAEGVALWSMQNGELVLDTGNWKTTHGFEDCISSGATRNDFRVINALARHGGALSRENLQKELRVDSETLEPWLEGCRKKHLIVQDYDHYRLHFTSPNLIVRPSTTLRHQIVSKASGGEQRFPRRYSRSDIERVAQAAFGRDFAIKRATDVFLPVYSITVENDDGTILTTYWNALTGKEIKDRYY